MGHQKKDGLIQWPTRKSASIIIITDGKHGKYSAIHEKDGQAYIKNAKIKKGLVVFLEANDILEISPEEEDIEAFQAFC